MRRSDQGLRRPARSCLSDQMCIGAHPFVRKPRARCPFLVPATPRYPNVTNRTQRSNGMTLRFPFVTNRFPESDGSRRRAGATSAVGPHIVRLERSSACRSSVLDVRIV
jgi:hypothetical protein